MQENVRLIDANALKEFIDNGRVCDICPNKKLNCAINCDFPDTLTPLWEKVIDSIPTIDNLSEYSDKLWHKAYERGKSEVKDLIIHEIARQYTLHNELIPIWLSIGGINPLPCGNDASWCESCVSNGKCDTTKEAITNEDINNAIKTGFSDGYEMAKAKYSPKTGHWEFDSKFTEFGNPYGTYKCSECGRHSSSEYPFCFWCGADMGVKEE